MAVRASYRKLDFVDYFKAFTETKDEWIEEFVSDRKHLATLEAFVTNRVVLGSAVNFLASEVPRRAPMMEKCLRQSARQYFLSKEDPRHIEVSDDVRRRYAELLPDKSIKGTKQDFWRAESQPSGTYYVHGDNEKTWSSIRRDEQAQYVDYWKVANYEEYEALLANRALLAKIDAFNRRLDEMEPHDHVADIADFAAAQLPSLEMPLRHLVLAHLGRDVQRGIVEIPLGLQADFPEIYAERGIT